MRWLVTTSADADLAEVRSALTDLGCEMGDNPPTPLGTEQVIQVIGPDDLPATALTNSTPVKGVYPDSELELY